jgi:general secretion pathway protein D
MRVVFTPAPVDVPLNGTFTVNLVAENASELYSAPLQIQFDPKILRMTDVTRGDLLARDGQQVIFTRNILNDTGSATINLSRFPGTGGVAGSGTLVSLTFQAVGKGATAVTLPGFSPRNPQLQPIPAPAPALPVTVR